MIVCCRFHHVQGAIHITPAGLIKLRSRPWHYKLMPNVAHHGMAHYHNGMTLRLPSFLEHRPIFKLAAASAGAEAHAINSLLSKAVKHVAEDDEKQAEGDQQQQLQQRGPGTRLLLRCLPLCTDV